MRRLVLLPGLALLVAAGPPPKLPAPVRTVEGVTEYQLDNGLRVLLVPDPSQAKQTVELVYRVGSRHEGYGETGMAHLLEHMQFKGTPTHKDIWTEMREHGASFNASTNVDRTEYHESFDANDDKLAWALELEADRMVNSDISADLLTKEFTVVRDEFEQDENSPGRILRERVLSTAYLWHNYGKSTIGSRSDIERVPATALKTFYKKYYQPDNATLILAGKLDRDKTLALIVKDFGAIPRPARKLDATYTVEPVQDGERLVTLRRVGDVQMVGVAYHTVAAADPRSIGFDALAYFLSDQPTGRLYKALVTTGMASNVFAFSPDMTEPGYFYVGATVPVGKSVEAARDKIIQIVEALPKQPPTDDDIARYKAREAKNFALLLTSSDAIAGGLVAGEVVGDWRLLFVGRDLTEKLTASQVAEDAASFLKPANRTVGLFLPTKGPERSPLPGQPDVAAMVKDYTGRQAVAEGEAFDATLDNVGKRTEYVTLPSGMKLALLPKKTRAQVVTATITLHYGTEKDLTGHEEAAELMGALIMRGSKKHTFEQIKSELDRLKAQVNIGGGAGTLGVRIACERPNLVPVVALVTELLQEPTFPKDEFEVVRKQNLTGLQQQLQDPGAQAQNTLQRHMSPWPKGDIRYVPTYAEAIARYQTLTLDEVKRMHKLVGASFAEGAVVGDFDAGEIKAALAGLGGWKSPKPFVRVATPFKPAVAGEEKLDTPDKEGAVVTAGLNLELRDDDPEYPALYMAGLVLGSGPNARLTQRLRQKEGWSYGAFGFVGADALDKRGSFIMQAQAAPQNADKAIAALVEELERLVKDGITADELDKAHKVYTSNYAQRLANDGAVAGLLSRDLYLGRTLDFEKQQKARIEAVKVEDVAAVLKKPYLRAEALIKVVAADRKKAAEQAGK